MATEWQPTMRRGMMTPTVARFRPDRRGEPMEGPVSTTFRIIGYVVIALMAAGILYANAIGIAYWTGIGV